MFKHWSLIHTHIGEMGIDRDRKSVLFTSVLLIHSTIPYISDWLVHVFAPKANILRCAYFILKSVFHYISIEQILGVLNSIIWLCLSKRRSLVKLSWNRIFFAVYMRLDLVWELSAILLFQLFICKLSPS